DQHWHPRILCCDMIAGWADSDPETPPDPHRIEDDYRDSELQHFLCHLGSVVALARAPNRHNRKGPENRVPGQRELARELKAHYLTALIVVVPWPIVMSNDSPFFSKARTFRNP